MLKRTNNYWMKFLDSGHSARATWPNEPYLVVDSLTTQFVLEDTRCTENQYFEKMSRILCHVRCKIISRNKCFTFLVQF